MTSSLIRYATGERSRIKLLDRGLAQGDLMGWRQELRVRQVCSGNTLCVTLVEGGIPCCVSALDLGLGISGNHGILLFLPPRLSSGATNLGTVPVPGRRSS